MRSYSTTFVVSVLIESDRNFLVDALHQLKIASLLPETNDPDWKHKNQSDEREGDRTDE